MFDICNYDMIYSWGKDRYIIAYTDCLEPVPLEHCNVYLLEPGLFLKSFCRGSQRAGNVVWALWVAS